MKENKCERCPCCGRHCRRDKLHCKKGIAHFDQLDRKEQKLSPDPDSLAHRFILTGKGVGKRMTKGKISEADFLAALSESEQLTLDEILSSLEPLTRKAKKGGQTHAR